MDMHKYILHLSDGNFIEMEESRYEDLKLALENPNARYAPFPINVAGDLVIAANIVRISISDRQ